MPIEHFQLQTGQISSITILYSVLLIVISVYYQMVYANSERLFIKQINLLEENLDLQLFVRTHRGLQLTEAGKSLAQDAKYIIQYCKDSVTRAKNVMKKSEDIIRIGTSSMTPAQVLVDLWPKLQEECPGVKFQLVPFDNTPENAREILANLGQNIDVIAGIWW